MSDLQLSLYLNKHYNFLSTVKALTPQKYNFIMSFHKDKKKSIIGYFNFVEETLQKVQDLVYSFDDRDTLLRFCDKFKDIFQNYQPSQVKTHISKFAFSYKEDLFAVRFDAIMKYDNILREWE